MENIISPDGKELILDFSYLQNVIFSNNAVGLDSLVSKLSINGVANFNDFILFLKASIVEKAYICLLNDSQRTIKNNGKKVFDGIIRVVLNNSSQMKIENDTYLGFFIDIDPTRPCLIVNNIFLTRLKPQVQAFETEIGNCEISIIRYGKEISDEDIIKNGLINSKNIQTIGKVLNNFNIQKEKWNKYLNFCQDQIDIKRKNAVPYLNLQSTKSVRIDRRHYTRDLQMYEIQNVTNEKIIYLRSECSEFLKSKNIPFTELYLIGLDVLVKKNQNLNSIIKSIELSLCPVTINKKFGNNFYSNNDINNFYNFEFERLSEGLESIKLNHLVYQYPGEGNFIDYWRGAKKIFMGDLNDLEKFIKISPELMSELYVKRMIYECEENAENRNLINTLSLESLQQGYLLQMSIGEEVLVNRGRNILKQITEGRTRNPYLVNYLFNTKLIELAQVDENISESNIEFHFKLNDVQKKAVVKALNTKDVFVIQGPPGTGKTQVISEIAYQLAKLNRKVLITSQNHEAINNVIERLPQSPDLNKIRLSAQLKPGDNQYSPERVVLNYYKSLDEQINGDTKFNGDKVRDILEMKSKIESLININKRSIEEDSDVVAIDKKIDELKDQLNKFSNMDSQRYKQSKIINDDLFYTDRLITAIIEEDLDIQINISNQFEEFLKNKISPMVNQFLVRNLRFNSFDKISEIEKLKVCFQRVAMENPALNEMKSLQEKIINAKRINDFEKMNYLNKEIENKKYLLSKSINYIELKNLFKNIVAILNSNKLHLESLKNNITKDNTENVIKEIEIQINKLSVMRSKRLSNVNSQLSELSSLTKEMKEKYNIDIDLSDDSLSTSLGIKLKEIDDQLIKIRDRKSLLGPIYSQMNNFTNKMYDFSLEDKNFRTGKISNRIFNETKKYSNLILENLINIYAMTLTSANLYRFDKHKNYSDLNINNIDLRNDNIEYVIIDEASKATMIEILMPLIYGKTLILVGDYRQLPPILKLQEEDVELVNELMDRNYSFEELYNILDKSLFKELIAANNKTITTMLNKQYRSHYQIAEIVNMFYSNQLVTDMKVSDKKIHGLEIRNHNGQELISQKSSVYWIDSSLDVDGQVAFEKSSIFSTSLYNENEIDITIEMVKKINEAVLLKNQNYKPKVAIISFYGLHVQKIKNQLKGLDLSSIELIVSTVDDYQGKEADYVIVNIVRNPKTLSSSYGREFLKRYERINVAFSRARELLIIVGAQRAVSNLYVEIPTVDDPNQTKTREIYSEIILKINSNARILSARDIIEV